MAIDIIYETHSTTLDNENGIATGWLPGELSAEGREQARQLGARRRSTDIVVVFVSDLARAMDTAELAFGGTGTPIDRDARLRECNYGTMNGMPVERVNAERPFRIDVPFPGGQSYRQVVENTRRFLQDLAPEWDGKTILIIAHSANKCALDHLLLGRDLQEAVSAPFDWKPGWNYTLPAHWEP
ncbi:MAG: histidine phosphatase family protein [Chloroflexota bacterium]